MRICCCSSPHDPRISRAAAGHPRCETGERGRLHDADAGAPICERICELNCAKPMRSSRITCHRLDGRPPLNCIFEMCGPRYNTEPQAHNPEVASTPDLSFIGQESSIVIAGQQNSVHARLGVDWSELQSGQPDRSSAGKRRLARPVRPFSDLRSVGKGKAHQSPKAGGSPPEGSPDEILRMVCTASLSAGTSFFPRPGTNEVTG
jgi:hypothetical protein